MNNVADDQKIKASATVKDGANKLQEVKSEQKKPDEASDKQEQTDQNKPDEGYITGLEEVLATAKSRASGGSKIRPNIGYTLSADGLKNLERGRSIPDQQKAILRVINKALSKDKPMITEPELHKLIVTAHENKELKTTQDPWHIFRYYRTNLKKSGVLQEVELQKAA